MNETTTEKRMVMNTKKDLVHRDCGHPDKCHTVERDFRCPRFGDSCPCLKERSK